MVIYAQKQKMPGFGMRQNMLVGEEKERQWSLEERLKLHGDFSLEALCARILSRHRDKISVQKPHVATANLARIVKAILDLSNRNGFHATTLRDLARSAGLSMGGLYSYFDSKDTLLMMILGEVSTTVTEVLHAAQPEVAADPAKHLRWLVEMHIGLTETMLPWFVFAYMEAKSFPPAGRKVAVESEISTELVFAKALEEGVRRKAFTIDDVAFTAALIKPLLQDWYVKRSKWRKRGIGPQDYADRVCAFIESAIAANRPKLKAMDRRAHETPGT